MTMNKAFLCPKTQIRTIVMSSCRTLLPTSRSNHIYTEPYIANQSETCTVAVLITYLHYYIQLITFTISSDLFYRLICAVGLFEHFSIYWFYKASTITLLLLTWLNGLVVSELRIRARGPGFDSQVVPLFHWVSCLLPKREYSAPM